VNDESEPQAVRGSNAANSEAKIEGRSLLAALHWAVAALTAFTLVRARSTICLEPEDLLLMPPRLDVNS
jgi:hypothetical protein